MATVYGEVVVYRVDPCGLQTGQGGSMLRFLVPEITNDKVSQTLESANESNPPSEIAQYLSSTCTLIFTSPLTALEKHIFAEVGFGNHEHLR